MGYPIGLYVPGGAFIYQMGENRLTLGFLTGLCYEDPLLDLYETFIKFKSHPFVANLIKGGKVVEAGARAVSTGGYYTLPKLAVDGGLFIGANAGIQYMPGLKGIHVSMKSGMLAAEAIIEAVGKESFNRETLKAYSDLFENSWINAQLYEGRNFYQALSKTNLMKFIHLGAQYFTKWPWIWLTICPLRKIIKPSNRLTVSNLMFSRVSIRKSMMVSCSWTSSPVSTCPRPSTAKISRPISLCTTPIFV